MIIYLKYNSVFWFFGFSFRPNQTEPKNRNFCIFKTEPNRKTEKTEPNFKISVWFGSDIRFSVILLTPSEGCLPHLALRPWATLTKHTIGETFPPNICWVDQKILEIQLQFWDEKRTTYCDEYFILPLCFIRHETFSSSDCEMFLKMETILSLCILLFLTLLSLYINSQNNTTQIPMPKTKCFIFNGMK